MSDAAFMDVRSSLPDHWSQNAFAQAILTVASRDELGLPMSGGQILGLPEEGRLYTRRRVLRKAVDDRELLDWMASQPLTTRSWRNAWDKPSVRSRALVMRDRVRAAIASIETCRSDSVPVREWASVAAECIRSAGPSSHAAANGDAHLPDLIDILLAVHRNELDVHGKHGEAAGRILRHLAMGGSVPE
jgi:hypothetical protein